MLPRALLPCAPPHVVSALGCCVPGNAATGTGTSARTSGRTSAGCGGTRVETRAGTSGATKTGRGRAGRAGRARGACCGGWARGRGAAGGAARAGPSRAAAARAQSPRRSRGAGSRGPRPRCPQPRLWCSWGSSRGCLGRRVWRPRGGAPRGPRAARSPCAASRGPRRAPAARPRTRPPAARAPAAAAAHCRRPRRTSSLPPVSSRLVFSLVARRSRPLLRGLHGATLQRVCAATVAAWSGEARVRAEGGRKNQKHTHKKKGWAEERGGKQRHSLTSNTAKKKMSEMGRGQKGLGCTETKGRLLRPLGSSLCCFTFMNDIRG